MEMEETYICFQVRDRYLYTTMLDHFLSKKFQGASVGIGTFVLIQNEHCQDLPEYTGIYSTFTHS